MADERIKLAITPEDKSRLVKLKDSLNSSACKINRHKITASDIIIYALNRLYDNADAIKESHGLSDDELNKELAIKIHAFAHPELPKPSYYDEL